MYISQVDFGSPAFDDVLRLRDRVLRKPLNMIFLEDQISDEFPHYHFGAYTNQGFLIGTYLLQPLNNRDIKMRQVAVNPEFQKKGIGSFMVEECEAFSKYKGFQKIVLSAREEAVPFYERLDYMVVGKKYKEVGIDHFKMYKVLS